MGNLNDDKNNFNIILPEMDTEVFRVNALYHKLDRDKKAEVLYLLKKWVGDELSSIGEDPY